MFEKSVWRKLRNWLVSKYIRLKLWIGEKRSQLSPLKKKNFWFTIIKSRVFRVILVFLLFSCPLTIAFLSSVVHINPLTDVKNYWEEILKVLKYHPAITTIALTLGSLPIALTLWLFRNHDIVKKLDLDMYHEAVKNIHDKDASAGLRQVAFTTLMELKEKWMWKEKIRKHVFLEAHLEGLDLQKANLQGFNMWRTKLNGLKPNDWEEVRRTNLRDVILQDAILQRAKLQFTDLRGAKLQGANLQNADMLWANLHETKLQNADLKEAKLQDAYYYENKEAEEKKEMTKVTKKWLRERGALHVETIDDIPEE